MAKLTEILSTLPSLSNKALEQIYHEAIRLAQERDEMNARYHLGTINACAGISCGSRL